MSEILIFGGTTEGRKIASLLSNAGVECDVCVATDYGEQVMEASSLVRIKVGRLSVSEMKSLYSQNEYKAVVDATHPFATEVTKNIKQSLEDFNIPLFRYERKIEKTEKNFCSYFSDSTECASYLESIASSINGTVFLTTGSKELHLFCKNEVLRSKIVSRVLPSTESLKICSDCGLGGRQIIAMQGPFSQQMNEIQLEDSGAEILVTKESGKTGGEDTKLLAAFSKGIKCLVIRKPGEQNKSEAMSLSELCQALSQILNKKIEDGCQIKISLAGIGMGSPEIMTVQVQKALREAQYVFGAQRMLDSCSFANARLFPFYLAEDIIPVLNKIKETQEGIVKAVVLFSGDTGFFSGSSKLKDELVKLEDVSVEILPGISSLSYLSAKASVAYQNIKIISLHGVDEKIWLPEFKTAVEQKKDIFLITSGAKDVEKICQILKTKEEADYKITIGFNLSYEDEKILQLKAADFKEKIDEASLIQKKGLYSVILTLENPKKI